MHVYDGRVIEKFTASCEKFVDFFNNHFNKKDKHKQAVKRSLELWPKFFKFVTHYDVEDGVDYYKLIEQYEENVKDLYKCGGKSFLTVRGGKEGSRETAYFHVLRCYIPLIASETYNDFRCGMGLWTMQGFERRNYESKTIARNFTNKKDKWLLQVIKRLWDATHWGKQRLTLDAPFYARHKQTDEQKEQNKLKRTMTKEESAKNNESKNKRQKVSSTTATSNNDTATTYELKNI